MFRWTIVIAVIVLSHVESLQSTTAQDFQVYTRIYDENAIAADGKSPRKTPIARSLTMFLAGKAYDYIEAIGEVVVIDFDPANPHYSLVNTRRELATSVRFEEVKNTLQAMTQIADQSIDRTETQGEAQYREVIGLHRFQRTPKFDEKYDPEHRRLTLASPFMRYEVTCQEPGEPAVVEAYLRYASAMARLNYILYPSKLYPEPRLVLNESLRQRQLLPTEVRLQLNLTKPVTLRAEHQITWSLTRSDRRNISEWESMLSNKRIRQVSLRDYQQEVLGALAKNQQ